jgi:FixJ family two-component response regulator
VPITHAISCVFANWSASIASGAPSSAAFVNGDISTDALRNIALHDFVQFNKPVKLRELTQAIEKLLAKPIVEPVAVPAPATQDPNAAKIFVVDDDDQVREALRVMLEDNGRIVKAYPDLRSFLEAYRPSKSACLLIDAYLPGMSGLELLQKLRDDGQQLAAIMITGNSDVAMAVRAMKAGASDFIEKPVGREELIAGIDKALERSQDSNKLPEWRESAATHLAGLTTRQREVMERVLAGPSQQEYRGRSRHQPANSREPSRVDHEADGIEVAARARPARACRRRRRRTAFEFRRKRAAVLAAFTRSRGRFPWWRRSPIADWRVAPSCRLVRRCDCG